MANDEESVASPHLPQMPLVHFWSDAQAVHWLPLAPQFAIDCAAYARHWPCAAQQPVEQVVPLHVPPPQAPSWQASPGWQGPQVDAPLPQAEVDC
jgi:hypothetical protein